MRFGSRRHTLPARRFDSHTHPNPTRTASPPSPKNCWTTVLLAGSMRESGYSNAVTHTEPSPAEISPPPPGTPTSMVATTLFVFGSIRDTDPSPWFNVHTAPRPAVMKRGALPTGIVSTIRLVCGSTRVTLSWAVLVTQTPPSPKAMPYDPDGT